MLLGNYYRLPVSGMKYLCKGYKLNYMKKGPTQGKEEPKKTDKFPLPVYSEDEDIYSKEKKVVFEEGDLVDEKKLKLQENIPGNDLDIPGSELDDVDEEIGEEDEENNYYSLGGERHENLEEDNG